MQTFLPSADFAESAFMLDYRRLGKQRVETKQILQCLLGEGSLRWARHPAVKMWKGHEAALIHYGIVMCLEWRLRGYNDSLLSFFREKHEHVTQVLHQYLTTPSWLGDDAFHASHRSNLLRKDPIFYARYNWNESPDMPYVWPIS